ncbi:MarR family winged helix-turn-helix transcriptional regulator [Actinopolymorpha singaporensis]|uniref:DNA-binding transcriptional regulator, MarR family n=1 Tax=Actinopolymorpha singaporensis TaxID=117157 RepID=A0A1H1MMQ0_9ACTN|nr:MarR family winged helix-turn-helix transcriptional regulator [Actinopolymorpha singaporensis]SDR87996.1 DNA-binding transcriptional regulator, MarR family [Actinopolymorpha singaporensis]
MPSPGVQASSLVVRLARELRTALDQRFAAFGLTSQQAGLLVHVFTGQSSQRRLADLLGTDTAGITRLVDRLAAKELVRRVPDPADRRAVVVELTKAGRSLIPELPPVFEAVAADLTRGVDPGDAAALLQTMLANLTDQDAD